MRRKIGGPEDVEMFSRGLKTEADVARFRVIIALKYAEGLLHGLMLAAAGWAFGVGS